MKGVRVRSGKLGGALVAAALALVLPLPTSALAATSGMEVECSGVSETRPLSAATGATLSSRLSGGIVEKPGAQALSAATGRCGTCPKPPAQLAADSLRANLRMLFRGFDLVEKPWDLAPTASPTSSPSDNPRFDRARFTAAVQPAGHDSAIPETRSQA